MESLELTDEGIGSEARPECPLPGTRTLVALPCTACSRGLESPVLSFQRWGRPGQGPRTSDGGKRITPDRNRTGCGIDSNAQSRPLLKVARHR